MYSGINSTLLACGCGHRWMGDCRTSHSCQPFLLLEFCFFVGEGVKNRKRYLDKAQLRTNFVVCPESLQIQVPDGSRQLFVVNGSNHLETPADCTRALVEQCSAATDNSCAVCAGHQQHALRAAGCSATDVSFTMHFLEPKCSFCLLHSASWPHRIL